MNMRILYVMDAQGGWNNDACPSVATPDIHVMQYKYPNRLGGGLLFLIPHHSIPVLAAPEGSRDHSYGLQQSTQTTTATCQLDQTT